MIRKICGFVFLGWIFVLVHAEENGPEPKKLDPTMGLSDVNVTVEEGKNAVLPCVVNNLGSHTVSWFGKGNPITIGYHVFLPAGSPVSVQHDEEHWNLILHETTTADEGTYTCQVSSLVPLQHNVHLSVRASNKKTEKRTTTQAPEVVDEKQVKSRARAAPGSRLNAGKQHEAADELHVRELHELRMQSIREEHEARMKLVQLEQDYLQKEHMARMEAIRLKDEKNRKRKRRHKRTKLAEL